MSKESMCKESIAITNRNLAKNEYLLQIQKILQHHPRALILREKDLDEDAYEMLAQSVLTLCRQYEVPMLLHGHIETGPRIDCDAIHLPFAQFCKYAEEEPDLLSAYRIRSVSCHSLDESLEAERLGATQIVLGTIFETECKPGLAGRGIQFVREVCSACRIPVYSIGGIKPDNLQSILDAGAAGGCMMSWFMQLP
ncbi:thiamine phosphate synthase [Agathobacter ruminis]|nr:thiamine phosphate synthase [Agathobacter ruminis]MDC7300542.1 thiamine phosphate synthase [Agathobacter ruminis]